MTTALASLVIATAVFVGASTLAIFKVKRRFEDAAAIRRRLGPPK
jgi:NhaP-type Na+/H+ or K+/H+ antiporter